MIEEYSSRHRYWGEITIEDDNVPEYLKTPPYNLLFVEGSAFIYAPCRNDIMACIDVMMEGLAAKELVTDQIRITCNGGDLDSGVLISSNDTRPRGNV